MTISDYVNVIEDGNGIETADRMLSICDLGVWNEYLKGLEKKYQVHCDHSKCRVSELYDTPEDAVARFLEIKDMING